MLKKLFIFLLIIVALFGIASAGLYFFWYLELPRVKEARGLIKKDFILDIEPINVPIIRNGSVERYIIFQISLTFDKQEQHERASQRLTALRDRFFSAIHQYTDTLTSQKSINKTTLQIRLTTQAQEILGEGNIKQALVTGAFQRQ